ncbi:MAG: dTMP kinase [Candidatus Omnitrophota bacterium]|nr:dTMP kinase [Candidatus Omnitrophota bacterium]
MKGKLITFEGPEGSGKSTHSKMLCKWLKQKGIPFVYTREPGGTRIGELIRKILLDPANCLITDKCELFLYLAGRAQIVAEVVTPAVDSGKLVISDRFSDATMAYQGYGNKLPLGLIKKLNNFATDGLQPDLTIILDINVKDGLGRSIKTKWPDRIEARTVSYHQRVRSGYRKLAKRYPKRIKLIKVKQDMKETQREVRKTAGKLLGVEEKQQAVSSRQ